MEDFSDFICSVCGEPIGPEPYFASFAGRVRVDPEPLWPESVYHHQCLSRYLDAKYSPD